jgi:hypothetical protein
MSRWGEMFAALSHQPDTVDTVDTVRRQPVIPLTVSHSVHCVTRAEREIEATAPDDAQQPAVVDCDEPDERAAIIEYGAGVPRRWAEGYAALSTMPAPTGFSPERWQRIVDAVGVFLDRWAAEAIRCGWSDLDVFGVDPDRPDARFDAMGLVLLLDRREIVSIDERGVDLITSPDHVHQRYYRRPRPVGTVLLWDSVVAKRGRDAG